MLLTFGQRHVVSHRPQVVGREEHQLVRVDPFLPGAADAPQELRDRVLLLSDRPLLLLEGGLVAGQELVVLLTFSQQQGPELVGILRERGHVHAHAL